MSRFIVKPLRWTWTEEVGTPYDAPVHQSTERILDPKLPRVGEIFIDKNGLVYTHVIKNGVHEYVRVGDGDVNGLDESSIIKARKPLEALDHFGGTGITIVDATSLEDVYMVYTDGENVLKKDFSAMLEREGAIDASEFEVMFSDSNITRVFVSRTTSGIAFLTLHSNHRVKLWVLNTAVGGGAQRYIKKDTSVDDLEVTGIQQISEEGVFLVSNSSGTYLLNLFNPSTENDIKVTISTSSDFRNLTFKHSISKVKQKLCPLVNRTSDSSKVVYFASGSSNTKVVSIKYDRTTKQFTIANYLSGVSFGNCNEIGSKFILEREVGANNPVFQLRDAELNTSASTGVPSDAANGFIVVDDMDFQYSGKLYHELDENASFTIVVKNGTHPDAYFVSVYGDHIGRIKETIAGCLSNGTADVIYFGRGYIGFINSEVAYVYNIGFITSQRHIEADTFSGSKAVIVNGDYDRENTHEANREIMKNRSASIESIVDRTETSGFFSRTATVDTNSNVVYKSILEGTGAEVRSAGDSNGVSHTLSYGTAGSNYSIVSSALKSVYNSETGYGDPVVAETLVKGSNNRHFLGDMGESEGVEERYKNGVLSFRASKFNNRGEVLKEFIVQNDLSNGISTHLLNTYGCSVIGTVSQSTYSALYMGYKSGVKTYPFCSADTADGRNVPGSEWNSARTGIDRREPVWSYAENPGEDESRIILDAGTGGSYLGMTGWGNNGINRIITYSFYDDGINSRYDMHNSPYSAYTQERSRRTTSAGNTDYNYETFAKLETTNESSMRSYLSLTNNGPNNSEAVSSVFLGISHSYVTGTLSDDTSSFDFRMTDGPVDDSTDTTNRKMDYRVRKNLTDNTIDSIQKTFKGDSSTYSETITSEYSISDEQRRSYTETYRGSSYNGSDYRRVRLTGNGYEEEVAVRSGVGSSHNASRQAKITLVGTGNITEEYRNRTFKTTQETVGGVVTDVEHTYDTTVMLREGSYSGGWPCGEISIVSVKRVTATGALENVAKSYWAEDGIHFTYKDGDTFAAASDYMSSSLTPSNLAFRHYNNIESLLTSSNLDSDSLSISRYDKRYGIRLDVDDSHPDGSNKDYLVLGYIRSQVYSDPPYSLYSLAKRDINFPDFSGNGTANGFSECLISADADSNFSVKTKHGRNDEGSAIYFETLNKTEREVFRSMHIKTKSGSYLVTETQSALQASTRTTHVVAMTSSGVIAYEPYSYADAHDPFVSFNGNDYDFHVNGVPNTISYVAASWQDMINASNSIMASGLLGSKGDNSHFIYMENGKVKQSSGNIGDDITPVYLNGGEITPASVANEVLINVDLSNPVRTLSLLDPDSSSTEILGGMYLCRADVIINGVSKGSFTLPTFDYWSDIALWPCVITNGVITDKPRCAASLLCGNEEGDLYDCPGIPTAYYKFLRAAATRHARVRVVCYGTDSNTATKCIWFPALNGFNIAGTTDANLRSYLLDMEIVSWMNGKTITPMFSNRDTCLAQDPVQWSVVNRNVWYSSQTGYTNVPYRGSSLTSNADWTHGQNMRILANVVNSVEQNGAWHEQHLIMHAMIEGDVVRTGTGGFPLVTPYGRSTVILSPMPQRQTLG